MRLVFDVKLVILNLARADAGERCVVIADGHVAVDAQFVDGPSRDTERIFVDGGDVARSVVACFRANFSD